MVAALLVNLDHPDDSVACATVDCIQSICGMHVDAVHELAVAALSVLLSARQDERSSGVQHAFAKLVVYLGGFGFKAEYTAKCATRPPPEPPPTVGPRL